MRALYLWVNDGAIFFTRCFWCPHQSQKLQTGFKKRRNFVIFRITKFWVKLIEIYWFFKFPNLIIVAITEIHQLSFESNLKFTCSGYFYTSFCEICYIHKSPRFPEFASQHELWSWHFSPFCLKAFLDIRSNCNDPTFPDSDPSQVGRGLLFPT